jgi:hypothetical protein
MDDINSNDYKTYKLNQITDTESTLPPKPLTLPVPMNKSYADIVRTQQPPVIAKLDTGATKIYVRPTDQHILTHIRPLTNSPAVHFPNGDNATPTLQGNLPLAQVSTTASNAMILPGLTTSSLIGVGPLVDDN